MTDLETLKLTNEEIKKHEEELRFLREWKDVMLECCMTHENNQILLARVKKEKMK